MKKIGLVLILFLPAFFFFFKITTKNLSYTYAQNNNNDNNCMISGNISSTSIEISVKPDVKICKVTNHTQSGLTVSLTSLFTIDERNEKNLILGLENSDLIDDKDRKIYFYCNKGVWEEGLVSSDKCIIKIKDNIDFVDFIYRNNNGEIKDDLVDQKSLHTPTPLPTLPTKVVCIVRDNFGIPYPTPLEVNKKICINNKIYTCPSNRLTTKIPAANVPRQITSQFDEGEYISYYEAELEKDCNVNNNNFSLAHFCNKPNQMVDIQSNELLYCTTEDKVELPISKTKVGSFDKRETDVYGFTCGLPKELIKSDKIIDPKDNPSRCCNIPKGYNTSEELRQAVENLGCLIDTEFLGQPIQWICYKDIVDMFLDFLGLDNELFSIQKTTSLTSQYETRACVEGLPLIPVEKQMTFPTPTPNYTSLVTLTPTPKSYDATPRPSPSPTSRPTIVIDGKSYVVAQKEELGLKDFCQCIIPPNSLTRFCSKYIKDEDQLQACANCTASGKFYTSLGCIPLGMANFLKETLFRLTLGIAGFIALICIIYSAFQIQTSSGNAEKIKKAQEILTSCIMGLMLIIFSVFILKLIGVDILKIPGFKIP